MGNSHTRRPRRRALALIVTAGLSLAGCTATPATNPTPQTQQASTRSSAEQQGGYRVKQVPVFREKLTDERATLRFYDDMPHVAYMNVADFYQLLLPQGKMEQKMQDDGTWLLTSHTGADPATAMEHGLGGTAVVDTVAGTLTSPDYSSFANTMSLGQDGIDNVYLDNVGIVRVERVEYDKPASPATIDFGQYGIIARGDDDGLWLPVHTLSSFFTNLRYDYALYNGQKLYVVNDNDYRSPVDLDPEFTDGLYAQAERPADLIAYNYAQLCLDFGPFYGKPASASEVLKTQGLDAYLQSLGDEGKAVKDALLSPDHAQYLHGTDGLHALLNVDEHTTIDLNVSSGLNVSESHKDLFQRYKALADDPNDPINKLVAQHKQWLAPENIIQLSCKKLAQEVYGDKTYIKQGDTAVIVMDSFDSLDLQAWRKHLAGEGERPSASEAIQDKASPSRDLVDCMAIFMNGLEQAQADPEVKYVVIDVTKNDGGSDDVVTFVTSLIANTSHEHFQNTLTGQTVTEYFAVDRNLDGAYDEKDAQVDYSDLHFAVLTSGYSYSCGNQFPSLLKDAGVPIIGEKSGGGSCSVQIDLSGDGPTYTHSSWISRLVNDAGEEIDRGVPVDVDLLERAGSHKELRTVEFEDQREEAEVHDYSSFFDLANLSQVMHELYP